MLKILGDSIQVKNMAQYFNDNEYLQNDFSTYRNSSSSKDFKNNSAKITHLRNRHTEELLSNGHLPASSQSFYSNFVDLL